MGTTIPAASIIVWALTYFPHNAELPEEQQMEQSYIGQIGKVIEPAIKPCGFQWKEGVSIITGIGAKEIVASTMGVLYKGNLTLTAPFAFLVFILLYMPCIPACIAVRHESGKWKWAVFAALYTTALAWICATLIYQIGLLF